MTERRVADTVRQRRPSANVPRPKDLPRPTAEHGAWALRILNLYTGTGGVVVPVRVERLGSAAKGGKKSNLCSQGERVAAPSTRAN